MSGALYDVILADPPWNERGGGKIKRGADRHYHVLTLEQIYNAIVLGSPCGRQLLTGWTGYFFLWCTSNHEQDAHELGRMLRLRYVTDFVWVKTNADGSPVTGLGQYRRSAHERLLLLVSGRPDMPRKAWPSSVHLGPRGEHSEKPEWQYLVAEHIAGACTRRLELFARRERRGWDGWGAQLVAGTEEVEDG